MGALLGWMYSISIKFNQLLPEGVKMNVGFYKICVYFPILYIFVLLLLTSNFVQKQLVVNSNFPFNLMLIRICHLFTTFCMFYDLYFTSKTLKTVELKRKIGFSDYAGEFFLMWFFPIGIWFLQPKINKIYADYFDKKVEI